MTTGGGLPRRKAVRNDNVRGALPGERCERRRWRMKEAERVTAVDKIEEKRKPEDFIGHRNRTSQEQ